MTMSMSSGTATGTGTKSKNEGGQQGGDDDKKVCGKGCPRCNNENLGYCIIKVGPGGHSGTHDCGNCGLAW